MPQPFEQYPLSELQNYSATQLKELLEKNAEKPIEPLHKAQFEKIAKLGHFLIANFPEEITSGEHVVDIAVRLLKAPEATNTTEPGQGVKTAEEILKKYKLNIAQKDAITQLLMVNADIELFEKEEVKRAMEEYAEQYRNQ